MIFYISIVNVLHYMKGYTLADPYDCTVYFFLNVQFTRKNGENTVFFTVYFWHTLKCMHYKNEILYTETNQNNTNDTFKVIHTKKKETYKIKFRNYIKEQHTHHVCAQTEHVFYLLAL